MSDVNNLARDSMEHACHDLAKAAFVQLESTILSAPSADHRVAAERYAATMGNIALARVVAEQAIANQGAIDAKAEQYKRDLANRNQPGPGHSVAQGGPPQPNNRSARRSDETQAQYEARQRSDIAYGHGSGNMTPAQLQGTQNQAGQAVDQGTDAYGRIQLERFPQESDADFAARQQRSQQVAQQAQQAQQARRPNETEADYRARTSGAFASTDRDYQRDHNHI